MEFDEVLKKRHSVRSYIAQIPPDSDIVKILQAADLAPETRSRSRMRKSLLRLWTDLCGCFTGAGKLAFLPRQEWKKISQKDFIDKTY
jgi:nitroreductase